MAILVPRKKKRKSKNLWRMMIIRVRRSKKKARSEKVNGEEKRKGGFYKPCALSPQLQKLVGESELGRPEVVKKIWAYIWEKKLQNPQNKRKILCDDFGPKQ